MRNKLVLIVILFMGFMNMVEAQQGCCSRHGGVAGCSSGGITICNDGTYSPTCTCTPPAIYGCTNPNATNYNSSANRDDGSCIIKKEGCTNSEAINYDSSANVANGTCQFKIIEQLEQDIPYKTIEESGKINEIKQEGKVGKEKITKTIIKDEDGNIISEEISQRETIVEPVDEIKIVAKNSKVENNEDMEDIVENNNEDDGQNISSGGFVLGILAWGGIAYLIYRIKKT